MPNREYDSRDTNQTRNEESSNSFLLRAIIGGVVGAAAALLLKFAIRLVIKQDL
jgi:hypothetical protein